MRPSTATRILAWLAIPLLLLAGCASDPLSSPPTIIPVTPATSLATPSAAEPLGEVAASSVAAASDAATQDPVAAPLPIDPVRPDIPVNLDDWDSRVDLWARVRRGFAMPDIDSKLVRSYERWYASRPDYVARMTERGGRYLFYVVEELAKRHMPTELALLPFIE
ncbi:MAG TPA: hypothetical protein VIM34_23975, partial [Burkholderiaceae bacterium]